MLPAHPSITEHATHPPPPFAPSSVCVSYSYAERQHAKAAQWWSLAVEYLRLDGGHPERLAMLERRLSHVTEAEGRSARRVQAQRSLGGPLPAPKNRFAVPLVFAYVGLCRAACASGTR